MNAQDIHVVGCGGVGGWLAQCLTKMLGTSDCLTLIDGDKFEDKNMDRQLHCAVGTNKANALKRTLSRSSRCQIISNPVYFTEDVATDFVNSTSVLFCAADNHPARLACLRTADTTGCLSITCANGETDAEAYVYQSGWAGTKRDPRDYFPEISTDKRDDPLSPSCTGDEILDTTPQLALANMSAANYGMWLWFFWTTVAPHISDPEARATFIHHLSSTAGRVHTQGIQS